MLEENAPFLLLVIYLLIKEVLVPLLKKTGTTIEQDIKTIKDNIANINVAVAVLQTQHKERNK